MKASISNSDTREGAAAVRGAGVGLSAMLLRTVNESTCPDPRSAPVAVRSNDIDTSARVSTRCSSETPASIAAPLTFRRVTADIVHVVSGCVRGSSTRVLTIGDGSAGAATAGLGVGTGAGDPAVQASISVGPATHHATKRALDVIGSIPRATPLETPRGVPRSHGKSPAYKPGSVSADIRERIPTPDGHSSRRAVAHTLQQPTRDSTSCDVLARRVISRRLFGLAPTGVYRATFVTEGAVGSYPTLSPLPQHRLPNDTAVCFLLHCPSHEAHAACAQALPGSLPCGARTFLGV